MIVVPFIPVHLEGLKVHKYMDHMNGDMNEEYGEFLASFPAFTALVDDEVVMCGGVVQGGVNRWQIWALMSEKTGKHMVQITRETKKFLETMSLPRVETHVRSDFKAGHRWLKMLGFINETPNGMKAWGDEGKDYCQYARVK